MPGLGRSPGGGNSNPLQYSCLENSINRGAWWATVHGSTKSRTWLTYWTHKYFVGCKRGCGEGGCLQPFRILNSIPGFYPLDVSSNPQVVTTMSLEIAKCPQGAKSLNTLALVLILLLWPISSCRLDTTDRACGKRCVQSPKPERAISSIPPCENMLAQVVTSLPYLKNEVSRQDFHLIQKLPLSHRNESTSKFFFQEVAWILPHKIMSRKAWLRLFWNRKYPKQMLTVTPRLIKNSQ